MPRHRNQPIQRAYAFNGLSADSISAAIMNIYPLCRCANQHSGTGATTCVGLLRPLFCGAGCADAPTAGGHTAMIRYDNPTIAARLGARVGTIPCHAQRAQCTKNSIVPIHVDRSITRQVISDCKTEYARDLPRYPPFLHLSLQRFRR